MEREGQPMNKTLSEDKVNSEFNYQSQHWAHKSKNGATVDKLIFEHGIQKGFELGQQGQGWTRLHDWVLCFLAIDLFT